MARRHLGATISAFFDEVAGIPSRSAYIWSGRSSIIAFLGAWGFFLARLLSPLQYIKYFDRKAQKRKKVIFPKRRLDFHAQKTELYFLGLLIGFGLLYALDTDVGDIRRFVSLEWLFAAHFEWAVNVTRIVTGFLLFESFVWLSYYCLWRNFVEPGYTLYHPAEYVILFPVIIVIQILGFCLTLNREVPVVLVSMIGSDIAGGIWQLKFLGWYYLAVLFSTIQAMVPMPRFKQNSNTAIIGAGDVVMKRLLPAIKASLDKSDFNKLEIFSLRKGSLALPPEFARTRLTLLPDENAILAAVRNRFGLVFVATPPDSHVHFMDGLIGTGARILCEKPLSNRPAEIRRMSAEKDYFRDNVFAMSYYSLEKALPFTYFATERRAYRNFLETSRDDVAYVPAADDRVVDCIHRMKRSLGKLKAINVRILEGQDRAPSSHRQQWAQKSSGILFETVIHALLIARRAIILDRPASDWPKGASPTALHRGRAEQATVADAITFVGLDMKSDEIQIALSVGAFIHKSCLQRTARLTFENGIIDMDFDKRSMTCRLSPTDALSLRVANSYETNYSVMVELAMLYAVNGWMGERFDDFDEQLRVLDWLAGIAADSERVVPFSYSVGAPSDEIAARMGPAA